ncbi:DUF1648 domain-containing protein [Bacteroidota bacterium]
MVKPRIIIKPSKVVRVMDVISIITIIYLIIISTHSYVNAPDIVPTHFDINGNPDNWGSKITLFIIPGLALFFYLIFTIISRFPHAFNYPIKITEENADRQYTLALKFLSLIKLSIIILFTFISFKIYDGDVKIKTIIPFPFIFIICVLLMVIGYFIWARRIR